MYMVHTCLPIPILVIAVQWGEDFWKGLNWFLVCEVTAHCDFLSNWMQEEWWSSCWSDDLPAGETSQESPHQDLLTWSFGGLRTVCRQANQAVTEWWLVVLFVWGGSCMSGLGAEQLQLLCPSSAQKLHAVSHSVSASHFQIFGWWWAFHLLFSCTTRMFCFALLVSNWCVAATTPSFSQEISPQSTGSKFFLSSLIAVLVHTQTLLHLKNVMLFSRTFPLPTSTPKKAFLGMTNLNVWLNQDCLQFEWPGSVHIIWSLLLVHPKAILQCYFCLRRDIKAGDEILVNYTPQRTHWELDVWLPDGVSLVTIGHGTDPTTSRCRSHSIIFTCLATHWQFIEMSISFFVTSSCLLIYFCLIIIGKLQSCWQSWSQWRRWWGSWWWLWRFWV